MMLVEYSTVLNESLSLALSYFSDLIYTYLQWQMFTSRFERKTLRPYGLSESYNAYFYIKMNYTRRERTDTGKLQQKIFPH